MITGTLLERAGGTGVREEDGGSRGWRMRGRALSPETQAAPQSRKSEEVDSPLKPPGGTQPSRHLDF